MNLSKKSLEIFCISDPPYNTRQYGANYHVPNYLVNYFDFEINEESKTALGDYNKSRFSQR